MSRYGDREAAVRRLLDTPHPPVPGDLSLRAAERGARLRRRARTARRVWWAVCAVAALAFVVWASAARPWEVPPAATTPVVEGW
ncbi:MULTISPECIES: hypothetical protein [Streptomyces]|uniref:Uncharacterized protein n=1 Tax=Streptomyces viridochromogenes TaxID=1938 RepID=A0A0L8JIK0_STRVR|nr:MULTISPECIES: hypothetical protein [Streptomyces]KOG13522.1 hypothetical protein ADK34_30655 [Streptomyces viridochromogenes]